MSCAQCLKKRQWCSNWCSTL